MKTLTDKQIQDLLNIGFGLNTSEKSIIIERQVLYSLARKIYQLGFKKGSKNG